MRPAAALRRLTAPLWLMLAAAAGLAAPLLDALGALLARLLRRPQPRLLARFLVLYLKREAAFLGACAGLWILSGFGRRLHERRFQLLHYQLLAKLVNGLVEPALAELELKVDVAPSRAAEQALSDRSRPLLFFSRHAGPGDSMLILHLLLTRYRRHPRVVLKHQLALEPVVDLVCRRLPNALIDPADQEGGQARIAGLARDLTGAGVLLLFPEGGNFSETRRTRAVARLRGQGYRRRAAQAEKMRHVIAPRPGGALAALEANPELDVIFAAHTGLGHETYPAQLWRRLPIGRTLTMRMWLSTSAERPADAAGQVEWLYEWWEHLDRWIESRGEE